MRVSYDIRIRMSLSFVFSPDSREVFACFLKTVARLSYDIRTSVATFLHCKFVKSSRRQVRDICTNVVRLSHERRATVARQSCDIFLPKKVRIKFLNMCKTYASSSGLVCDT